MVATRGLSEYRSELMESLEHLRQSRHAAHSGLVGEHIALAGDLTAGPLCLALADALGARKELRQEAGLTTALLELSSLALRSLTGESASNPLVVANGLPLALNSADAPFALAHLTVLDLASSLEGLESKVLASFDALCLSTWRAQGNGTSSDSAAPELGRTAGALAAFAAGRDADVEALGDFGARLMAGAAMGQVREAIDRLPVGASIRERLGAILA